MSASPAGCGDLMSDVPTRLLRHNSTQKGIKPRQRDRGPGGERGVASRPCLRAHDYFIIPVSFCPEPEQRLSHVRGCDAEPANPGLCTKETQAESQWPMVLVWPCTAVRTCKCIQDMSTVAKLQFRWVASKETIFNINPPTPASWGRGSVKGFFRSRRCQPQAQTPLHFDDRAYP